MKNIAKFIGIIAIAAVIIFGITACGDGDGDGGGSGGGVTAAQLHGRWIKNGNPDQWIQFTYIQNYSNGGLAQVSINEQSINFYSNTIDSFDGSKVVFGSFGGGPIYSFNVAISGTTLTISNWETLTAGAKLPAMNGDYTKE